MKSILLNLANKIENLLVISDLQDIPEKPNIVIINSVIQYLKHEEFEDLIQKLRIVTQENSLIVLSDILPPNYSTFKDTFQLIFITLRHGIFIKFIYHILRSLLLAPVENIQNNSLTKYDFAYLNEFLTKNNYQVLKNKFNFTYSTHRYTLLLKRLH